jgi:branched-chain amino acid transport system substrate-binding protein
MLKLAALTAVPGTLGSLVARSAFAQGAPLQFACPVPMSGAFAANGKYADLGMKLAIEQYGKVLGQPLSYTVLDTEGKPATAVRRVQEVAQQKNVRYFAGGILSSESLAMANEVEKDR